MAQCVTKEKTLFLWVVHDVPAMETYSENRFKSLQPPFQKGGEGGFSWCGWGRRNGQYDMDKINGEEMDLWNFF